MIIQNTRLSVHFCAQIKQKQLCQYLRQIYSELAAFLVRFLKRCNEVNIGMIKCTLAFI